MADCKTVCGIHREFAPTPDPSGLKRFRTEATWDVQALHRRRPQRLPKHPATRSRIQGVIALDNVLIDHDGHLIADASGSWDHAEDGSTIAQDSIGRRGPGPSSR